ncbi:unconventional myosin-Va isoform X1 [Hetaerina americana]|uniref:unconventional myosin-Va isoform X1 n=1 Tax=Hetaerina americana TaxID=62018 RepID=UPI003A7F5135
MAASRSRGLPQTPRARATPGGLILCGDLDQLPPISVYNAGARVWIPNPDTVWEGAELVEDYVGGNIIRVSTKNGKVVELEVKGGNVGLPPLRNPDILIGENDLTSLSYLHEPAVLYNLKVRFCNHNSIYTYCGIVLVAINPYEELPIYGSDIIWLYRGQAMGELDPHIFAVAEEAYTKLERESQNQSIIVSGESGAGKTVSAKYAMRYFATVGGSSTETQVEKKVLASSPIMEAIGNAKTTRNDNSSRFGKFVEIHFNDSHHITGASMRTYLLEKSRVVFQASGERNYHIFYQLCAARELPLLQDLHLGHQDYFHYTNQGESSSIDGIDDLEAFSETRSALSLLGFSESDQMSMFRVLAAILHLGNVNILEGGNPTGEDNNESREGSHISRKDKHLKIFSQLMQIDAAEIGHWLCHRRIVSTREVFTKPMTAEQAQAARDALAKHVYACLFNWIVQVVNKTLESTIKTHKFIGVLDIYGFETFEINSFEQFCINYANEKLQQQFNQHVFKLEQEEYLKEEIDWKFIDFCDNQPCIDLIESKLGILDLLDEECRMPKGTDQSWADKLFERCAKWKHFAKPRFSNSAFVIRHFADDVQYESGGFLEKNRDTVIEEQMEVLRTGQNKLLTKLFTEEAPEKQKLTIPGKIKISAAPKTGTLSKQHKRTVGSQFRDSLQMLMCTLNATTPHYVRCIKPNDEKGSFEYNPVRAVQQLRACGVLETIRISAAGYPSRWTYLEFFQRYRVLCKSKDIKYNNMKGTCEVILHNFISEEDKFQFGKTKIFFRAGQVAYLEKLRAERLKECCVLIQKRVRGWIARKKYRSKQGASRTIQRYARGFIARRRVYHMRRLRAAIILQKHMRRWMCQLGYRRLQSLALGLQARARGLLARRKYLEMRRNAAAVVIQRHIRGWLARCWRVHTLEKIVIVQCRVRCFLAKRRLRHLKKEARSVEHIKKLNKGLENKIISLQQRIGELTKEREALKNVHNELNEVRSQLEHVKASEMEWKGRASRLESLEAELEQLRQALSQEKDEKMDILQEKDRLETLTKEVMEKSEEEIGKLKSELNIMNEKIREEKINAEERLKLRLEEETAFLNQEHDQDRNAYQKLLMEYHALEQQRESLERELALKGDNNSSGEHQRSLSNASTTSVVSASSELPEDDFGYGSVRSAASSTATNSHTRVDAIDWQQQGRKSLPQSTTQGDGSETSVILILKLQQKIKELEREKGSLERRLEEAERDYEEDEEDGSVNRATGVIEDSERKAVSSPRRANLAATRTRDNLRLQELEMENSKLREALNAIRKSVAEGEKGSEGATELMDQFVALQEELERRREECVQLRGVLANQTQGIKSVANASYGSDVDIINEDGELVMAFEAQKKINRQLEDELQIEKSRREILGEELRQEIDRLREDNDRQQRLLSLNLGKGPQTQSEAILQHEIKRLTSENLDLQEKLDAMTEQARKYKKNLKVLAKKLRDTGGIDLLTIPEVTAPAVPKNTNGAAQPTATLGPSLPVVRKMEREYMGMFEYRQQDEAIIMRHLIIDLKPKLALTLLPGLPAYILFMCIRHTDFINDDDKVRSLLTTTINSIKRIIKKRHDDFDTTVLWLTNTLRLLHNLKQYSGDKAFQSQNTPKQNEQCLRNFDLSEYRQVLSDIAVWIYQGVIKYVEERVQQMVVPAILEHDAILGLSGQKPGGMRGRAASVSREGSLADSGGRTSVPGTPGVEPGDLVGGSQKSLHSLLGELSQLHKMLRLHGVDPQLIGQLFRQVFYFICASALNNLMMRKDLCHWAKGMQIRYNLSHLEEWVREHHMQEAQVAEMLQPIIQAAHLLQARKTDDDVQSVCEMCDKLSSFQIVKILNVYTAADDFEEKVPLSFIRKIQQKLNNRPAQSQTLLMETKFSFPVRFPFNPSNIRLEDIEIPESLNLPMLKKV